MVWVALIVGIILLFAFPKQTLVLASVLVAAIALLLLVGHQNKEKRKRLEDAVVVSVQYDPSACGTEYPIRVKITNSSKRTVTKVEWSFSAFRPGFSTDLIGFAPGSSDKIMASGESYTLCFKPPAIDGGHEPSGLEWKTRWKRVEFESK